MQTSGGLRRRVLLIVYKCSPFQGSEWGVGWGRINETAKHFDTWVLTSRVSRPDLQTYFASHGPLVGVRFVFVESGWFERMLQKLPSVGAYNYPAYNQWHRTAFRVARRLHEIWKFHAIHQVNISGFREPGYCWKLDVPFIWGPIGGTQLYPWRFLLHGGLRNCFLEGLRNCITLFQLHLSPRVRSAATNAVAVLAANTQCRADLASAFGIDAHLLLETGLRSVAQNTRPMDPSRPLQMLWIGNLEPHKALHLLLYAIADLPMKIQYVLKVVGSGPLLEPLKTQARASGVDGHIEWMGQLSHEDTLVQYTLADCLVFTSLRDTSGNVVLEAFSHGVPVICLDHQGVRDIVTIESGIKLAVEKPALVICALRDAIAELAMDRRKLAELSDGALARASEFAWSQNGERMAVLYNAVIGSREMMTADGFQPEEI